MSITEIGAKVREMKIAHKLTSASVETVYTDYCVDVTIRLAYIGDNDVGMDAVRYAHSALSSMLDKGGSQKYPYAEDFLEYKPNSQMWYGSIYRRFLDINSK